MEGFITFEYIRDALNEKMLLVHSTSIYLQTLTPPDYYDTSPAEISLARLGGISTCLTNEQSALLTHPYRFLTRFGRADE